MLKTIQALPLRKAEAILSAAMARYLPYAFEGEEGVAPLEEDVSRLLEEVAANTNTRAHDPRNQEKQLEYLASEVERLFLSPGALEGAEQRLGDRGELHPSQYKVNVAQVRQQPCRLRDEFILRTIRRADAFQHLGPKSTREDLLSLFTKTDSAGVTSLVVARRQGSTLEPINSWLLPHEDVRVADASTPMELLEAFLLVFGGEFANPNFGGTKLIKYYIIDPIPLGPGGQVTAEVVTGLLQPVSQPKSVFYGASTIKIVAEMPSHYSLHVMLGYSVNVRKYEAMLRKRGLTSHTVAATGSGN